METTAAFVGLSCIDCGERFDPDANRCPACGGILDPAYDYGVIDLTREELAERPFDSMWRYEELLPFPRESAITIEEGATPLVECEKLAAEMGVGRVLIKDEGRNPTGSFKDRGQTVAMTAAAQQGASDVALASAGNAGQAAAAYAGRADIDAHVFLPSRAGFTNKAMVNVHGGDMTVVGGRIGDAGAAYADAMAEEGESEGWHSVGTFVTPYRHEGKKTMAYETIEQLDWEVPDAVVYPTGGGVGLVGMHKAATELRELGLIDELPAMYAAQSSGCAPIVEAFEAGKDRHEPVEHPDTICGGIEIPDPGASPWILECLRESGGGAVATDDEEILESAIGVAKGEGVEMGATCAAAASGAWKLADEGEFGADDTVVLLNTATSNKDSDVLRSHLMGKGI
ncbi:threonine synthase [Halalkalicoccus jeotgali]|uniref:Threonine synthase n=1 Tax=Halalkalicoccus jeotgali (strain DSM 18796 / CECT 7217 / JCM 14584 / KCTC 4019 / B3) TaxID=795797 RepID=D8J686_HALJB|nr:threonine synthase [Halalkalicoccus jeotgali]ADJ15804.1 threonine synthase [Halalkalicoccus jeotgali B3]ELY37172.1 threonine synthase [Halalkalicoccus jeotgali B3]